MEENKLLVSDDQGREYEMTILFTYHDESTAKDYVVYFDEKDEAGQLYAATYNEEGELFPVEGDEEVDKINEVIEAYLSEQEKA